MKIGFIGAGNVAQTYAKYFVRYGHEVVPSLFHSPMCVTELSPSNDLGNVVLVQL